MEEGNKWGGKKSQSNQVSDKQVSEVQCVRRERDRLCVCDTVMYSTVKCLKYLMMISQTSFFFFFFYLFIFTFFFSPLIAVYANDMQCYGCPIWYISMERRITAAAELHIINAKGAEILTRKTKWEESTHHAQLSIICCQSDWQMFKLSPQMCDWLIFYVVDVITGCQHHLAVSLRGNFPL